MMFASGNNRIEIVKALVVALCDLNMVDNEGHTALMLVVK